MSKNRTAPKKNQQNLRQTRKRLPQRLLSAFLVLVLLMPWTITSAFADEAPVEDLGAQSSELETLDDGNVGNALDGCVIEIQAPDYLRQINVRNDAGASGQDLWLWNIGSSSKQLLEWSDEYQAYKIYALSNYRENTRPGLCWDLEGEKTSEGTRVHIYSDYDDDKWMHWRFYRNADGTYYIKNVAATKLYVGTEDSGGAEKNHIILTGKDFEWMVTVLSGSEEALALTSYTDGTNWMSWVNGKTRLSDISIPGTHDTGTCYVSGAADPHTNLAQTQKYYLDQQLNVGVRSLDIRLGAGKDPEIVHGSNLFSCKNKDGDLLRLSEVMQTCKDFLAANPTETIIMTLSDNGGRDPLITAAVEKYIKESNSIIWPHDTVPKLSEVRGKIVLMRRFELKDNTLEASSFGVDLTGWNGTNFEDASGHKAIKINGLDDPGADVWVQDHYSTTGSTKVNYVFNTLSQAEDIYSGEYLFNYTSCTKSSPYSAAQYVQLGMYDYPYFDPDYTGYLGIVAFDYIDAAWAQRVYRTNINDPDVIIVYPESIELTYGESLDEAVMQGQRSSEPGTFTFQDGSKTYPEVSDSNSTTYNIEFRINNDPQKRVWSSDVTVTVHPRPITIRPLDQTKVYGDDIYYDPAFSKRTSSPSDAPAGYIPYVLTNGSLAERGKEIDRTFDLGLYFFAYDESQGATAKIGSLSLVGSYKVGVEYADKTDTGSDVRYPNYDISFEGMDYENDPANAAHYTISQRVAEYTWQGADTDWKVGEPVLVTATASNLIPGDECTVKVGNGTENSRGPHRAYVEGLEGAQSANYTLESTNSHRFAWYVVRLDNDDIVYPTEATLTYGTGVTESAVEFNSNASEGGSFFLGLASGGGGGEDLSHPDAGTYTEEYLVYYKEPGGQVHLDGKAIKVTVNPFPVTAVIENAVYTGTYGDALPSYSFTVEPGLFVGDEIADQGIVFEAQDANGTPLSTHDFVVSGTAYNNSPVGVYSIVGTEQSANYDISFTTAYQVIQRKPLSFEWSGHSGLVYDGNAKLVSAQATNLIPLPTAISNTSTDPSDYDDCTLTVDNGDGLTAGNYRALITGIVGADANNYKLPDGVALYQNYQIEKAEPVAVFPLDGVITQGQTLAQTVFYTQGSADVAGKFTFVLSERTPEVGNTLTLMRFTPEDNENYKVVRGTTWVKVLQGPTPPNPPAPGPDNPGDGLAPTGDSRLLAIIAVSLLVLAAVALFIVARKKKRG